MVNEEVLGGLRSALERGESLNKAMITLYNAGYTKEEIEECARLLVPQTETSRAPTPPVQPQQIQPRITQPVQPVTRPQYQQPVQPQYQQPIQPQYPQATRQQVQPVTRPQYQQPIQPQYPQARPPYPQDLSSAYMQMSALPIQRPSFPAQITQPLPAYAPIQRVSGYEEGITPREKAIIVILVSLLAFLLVSLGLIFLFKDQIINFFGNLFG